MAAVIAVLVAQSLVPVLAWAGFSGSASAAGTIGTGTLAPATSPSAARSTCVPLASTSITVSWTTSSLATSYQVSYGTVNGGPYGTTVVASGAATATITIAGLAFSTTYYAVVVAAVGGWTSAATSQVSVTTQTNVCL